MIEERGFPLEDAPFHGPGWQAHREDLTRYVAGKQTSNWEVRWKQLLPVYRAITIQ